jgi:hypothetical protein
LADLEVRQERVSRPHGNDVTAVNRELLEDEAEDLVPFRRSVS